MEKGASGVFCDSAGIKDHKIRCESQYLASTDQPTRPDDEVFGRPCYLLLDCVLLGVLSDLLFAHYFAAKVIDGRVVCALASHRLRLNQRVLALVKDKQKHYPTFYKITRGLAGAVYFRRTARKNKFFSKLLYSLFLCHINASAVA